MSSIGISEFTFGYAFLFEQTHANWGNLTAAPILPSLQQERNVGWDARLPRNGIDFYYQFKLSEYFWYRNSKFIADGTYQSPYYRLALHRKNNNQQHQRLKVHAVTSPNTFYVGPEFNSIDDFNTAFLSRQITAQSRLIPVAECDDIFDGKQHYITFQPGQMDWDQHSERKRHRRSFFGKDLGNLYESRSSQWRRIDKRFADELFDKTLANIERIRKSEDWYFGETAIPLLDFNLRQAEQRDVLLRVSQILSVTFGITLVLAGTSE